MLSMLEIFDNELFNNSKFSLFETENTKTINNITNGNGISIINEIFWWIKNIYTNRNKIDLINTFILKTEMIANEWIIKFLKLIFDGPKYLDPLIDGTVDLSFSNFVKAPEKLLQVALSLIIFSTVDFGKQV